MKLIKSFHKILLSMFCFLILTLILHNFPMNCCYSQTRIFPQAKLFKENVQDFKEIQDSKFKKKQTASSMIIWDRIDPICFPFFENDKETYTLMLKVAHNDIKAITLKPDPSKHSNLIHEGINKESIQLFDDGTHGDETPADNIFSVDKIGSKYSYSLPLNNYSFWRNPIDVLFEYTDGRNEIHSINLKHYIKNFDATKVAIPTVHQLAEDVWATDYVVNIVFKMQESDTNRVDVWGVIERFYELFPDDVDFLVLEMGYGDDNYSWGYSSPGSFNDVGGIGRTSRVNTPYKYQHAWFGRGYIDTHTLNHENFHRWGVHLYESLDLNYWSHWGVIERHSSGFGQGSGLDWYNGSFHYFEQIGDSLYEAWSPRNVAQMSDSLKIAWFGGENHYKSQNKFNDLELYLMGLIGPSEVKSPIRTLVNPKYQNKIENDNKLGIRRYLYKADGIREVTMEEFINVMGPRFPNYLESQKDFKLACIVMYHRPLQPIEFAYYDYGMRFYEKPKDGYSEYSVSFQEATGNRATMTTKIGNFSENAPPGSPILFSQKNKKSDIDISVTLKWLQSFSAISYHLQVSTDSNFADDKMVIDITDLSTNTFLVETLEDDTKYYWRVNATNHFGKSDWSQVSIFLTNGTIISVKKLDASIPNRFSLSQNYPNPFNPKTNIKYELTKEYKLRLTIYNIQGFHVATVVDKIQPAGFYSAQWDGNDDQGRKVASGIYFYRLETKELVRVRKLVLMR